MNRLYGLLAGTAFCLAFTACHLGMKSGSIPITLASALLGGFVVADVWPEKVR